MSRQTNFSRKRNVEDIEKSDLNSLSFQQCARRFANVNGLFNNDVYHYFLPLFSEALNLGLNGTDACDYMVREFTRRTQHLYLNPIARYNGLTPFYQEFY